MIEILTRIRLTIRLQETILESKLKFNKNFLKFSKFFFMLLIFKSKIESVSADYLNLDS